MPAQLLEDGASYGRKNWYIQVYFGPPVHHRQCFGGFCSQLLISFNSDAARPRYLLLAKAKPIPTHFLIILQW